MAGILSTRLLDSVTTAIERAESLDRISTPIAKAIHKVRKPGWMTNILSGSFLSHPFHPLLVTVPIGTWTGAVVLDAIRSRDAARTMVGVGVISAVPTIWTGLSDWADTKGATQRVGLVHAAANYGLVGLYAASWVARRRGNHGVGVLLTLPALGLLGLSGWLGGHLSYARGVGIDNTTFENRIDEWTDVASADTVQAGALTAVTVAGESIILTRTDGDLVAYSGRCTHRGGPLSQGTLVDGCVQCPWHGSQFDLASGNVVAGPATRKQPAYHVRTDGGRVLVRKAGVV